MRFSALCRILIVLMPRDHLLRLLRLRAMGKGHHLLRLLRLRAMAKTNNRPPHSAKNRQIYWIVISGAPSPSEIALTRNISVWNLTPWNTTRIIGLGLVSMIHLFTHMRSFSTYFRFQRFSGCAKVYLLACGIRFDGKCWATCSCPTRSTWGNVLAIV